MSFTRVLLATAALSGALAVAACGREADKAARTDFQSTGAQATDVANSTTRTSYQPRRSARQDDGPRFQDGKPEWASNRQSSGAENAQKQFERDGKDFGATTVEDYVAKAHAFISSPPKGVLTLTRSNGDVLYYDPKTNVFAVADRQGAPRAMFKPQGGMSYWTQQKDRMAQQDSRSDSQSARPSRRYRARAADEDSSG
jgi:pyocin large subunit-like protein